MIISGGFYGIAINNALILKIKKVLPFFLVILELSISFVYL